MTANWGTYEEFDPDCPGDAADLSRAEARTAFRHCMETKPKRLRLLQQLVELNGVELSSSDSALQRLDEWFFDNVEADPDNPGFLAPRWYSVAHDVALLLGDTLIERHANLRWELFIWGAKNVSYQRHVIMGMSAEDPKLHTNIDIDRGVRTYGHQIIARRGSVHLDGPIPVRGVNVNVDEIAASHRAPELRADRFLEWIQVAARRA